MILKRLFDICASASGLVVLSPLLVMVAVCIKLTSRGPVFFRQERVGKGFVPFRIYKFRTMVVDAPKLGAQISTGSDPRITTIGRLLRKAKIDELPQLINVLFGEMSLVGPRPEVPKYVQCYRDDYEEILEFRPGITDLAAITYRDENEILDRAEDPEKAYIEKVLPDKIRLYKVYCERQTLVYDLYLILLTVYKLLPNQRTSNPN